jgi:putative Holliday junction resolvase
MNNTIGDRAEKSLEFAEMLKKRTGLPVVMWDERLTTVEAKRTLMDSGVRRENRKTYVDKIAAVFILQGYLDLRSNRSE